MLKKAVKLTSGLVVGIFGLISCNPKVHPKVDQWESAPQLAFGEPLPGSDSFDGTLVENIQSSSNLRVYLTLPNGRELPPLGADRLAGTRRAVASTVCRSQHGEFFAHHEVPVSPSWSLNMLVPPALFAPYGSGEIESSYRCQFGLILFNQHGSSRKRYLPTITYVPTLLGSRPQVLKLGTDPIQNGESIPFGAIGTLKSQTPLTAQKIFLSCESGTFELSAGTTPLAGPLTELTRDPSQISSACRLIVLANEGLALSPSFKIERPHRSITAHAEAFFSYHGGVAHSLFSDVLSISLSNPQDFPIWLRIREQTPNFLLKITGYNIYPANPEGTRKVHSFAISRSTSAWVTLSKIETLSEVIKTEGFQFVKLKPREQIQISMNVQLKGGLGAGSDFNKTGYDFSMPDPSESMISWGNGTLTEKELSKFRPIGGVPTQVLNAARPTGPQRLTYWQIWPQIRPELASINHTSSEGPFAAPEDLPWWEF